MGKQDAIEYECEVQLEPDLLCELETDPFNIAMRNLLIALNKHGMPGRAPPYPRDKSTIEKMLYRLLNMKSKDEYSNIAEVRIAQEAIVHFHVKWNDRFQDSRTRISQMLDTYMPVALHFADSFVIGQETFELKLTAEPSSAPVDASSSSTTKQESKDIALSMSEANVNTVPEKLDTNAPSMSEAIAEPTPAEARRSAQEAQDIATEARKQAHNQSRDERKMKRTASKDASPKPHDGHTLQRVTSRESPRLALYPKVDVCGPFNKHTK